MKKLTSLNELKENIIPPLEAENAPGWIILFSLLGILVFYILFFTIKAYKKNSYRRAGLCEIRKIEDLWRNQKDQSTLRHIPLTLKKVAYQFAPQSLSFSGTTWIEFLHHTQSKLERDTFKLLPVLAYDRDESIAAINENEIEALIANSKLWIKTHQICEAYKP
ncbi:DUF4381 family protein [Lentisphaera marina]|uniref:DUF4381 family protein n=1 Tax=Lentisphaera marina TaxID=1111041 RepID=UPI002366F04C|nr:DUF4381 family protein [Lentisphaera marina]MDD7983796.1 DUF4381 family protein [Lentisphaera marina]